MASEKIQNPSVLPETADDMICFAIYSAGHALNRTYNPLLKKLGLTYPQYIAMTVLWETGPVTVGALGARLKLETNTLTPLLKRLEKSGHVERIKGKGDERQVYISVTPKGQKIRAQSGDITKCIIDATGYDISVLEALVSSISQLRDNVTRAEERRQAKA